VNVLELMPVSNVKEDVEWEIYTASTSRLMTVTEGLRG